MSTAAEASWRTDGFSEKEDRMSVFFKTVQVKDTYQSNLQQRPVFKEVIHIVKMVAGDKNLVVDRPIHPNRDGIPSDSELYPEAFQRFKDKKDSTIPGTPIDLWHSINDTQKAEFRAMNIFTVEQFASLSDAMAGKIHGFHDLREKARVFVMSGKDAELMGKLREEMNSSLASRDAEIRELRAMLEAATAPKAE